MIKGRVVDERVNEVFALGRPGRETDRARTTVELALRLADESGHCIFDTCHWLSGMYREGSGVAFHVMKKFGVTQRQIDDSRNSNHPDSERGFQVHDDIRLLFDAAIGAVNEMSHNYLGTEHLLIGAMADGTASARLIQGIGVDPRDVETEVFHLMGHRFE